MLFDTALGLSVLLITNLSLLYAAHLLVRRFAPQSPASVRLVATGTLFYAFIILIFQALSPFHAISRLWVTVACLALACLFHLLWGDKRNIEAEIGLITVWLKNGLQSRWAALLVIGAFVVLFSFSRALLMPPLAWDCLTYHLTVAALWIQKGSLVVLSAPDQLQYAHFPINGEIFASWLLLPFHNDLLVNTMNFPITLLGGMACYAIARELGLGRKQASFAPLLICFSPMIFPLITTEYVDPAVFAFCCAAVLFALRYLKEGCLSDALFALIAAGVVLGIKFTGIAITGLIFAAVIGTTALSKRHPSFFAKAGITILGLLIICALGGRQYILNAIDARNPFYPLPVRIMNHELFKGWSGVDQMNEWISEYEISQELDKLGPWERMYRKFYYLSLNAGPKFAPFLFLAIASLFVRSDYIPKRYCCFLSLIWIIPCIVYFTGTAMDFARKGYYLDSSTRFLSPCVAIFTIQGLAVMSRIKNHSRPIEVFLIGLFGWDLLYMKKTHLDEVGLLYPLVVVLMLVCVTLYNLGYERFATAFTGSKISSSSTGPVGFNRVIIKRWLAYCTGFIVLVLVLYCLQTYRDHTRYAYYRTHVDLNPIPGDTVNGWEFLDNPREKKTIALAMDWAAPGHNWFFYPLLGRWLQNEVVYLSAKYQGDVPARLHRGMLRGDNLSVWLYNAKKQRVDYILARTPWPIELRWMESRGDTFELVFYDKAFRIFRYRGEKE
jgi:hypothetical protein